MTKINVIEEWGHNQERIESAESHKCSKESPAASQASREPAPARVVFQPVRRKSGL